MKPEFNLYCKMGRGGKGRGGGEEGEREEGKVEGLTLTYTSRDYGLSWPRQHGDKSRRS